MGGASRRNDTLRLSPQFGEFDSTRMTCFAPEILVVRELYFSKEITRISLSSDCLISYGLCNIFSSYLRGRHPVIPRNGGECESSDPFVETPSGGGAFSVAVFPVPACATMTDEALVQIQRDLRWSEITLPQSVVQAGSPWKTTAQLCTMPRKAGG
jgi:hypothetical protein